MYDQAAGQGGARDRITQALMAVQNPPPVADVPQMPMPPMGGGAPPAPGAAPPPATPAAAPPMAGAPPMMPQLGSATPGAMQPGGMLSAQPRY
jgi:hypothetical protein